MSQKQIFWGKSVSDSKGNTKLLDWGKRWSGYSLKRNGEMIRWLLGILHGDSKIPLGGWLSGGMAAWLST